jgi:predicted DsbA family dithiol-disulfide isomerase
MKRTRSLRTVLYLTAAAVFGTLLSAQENSTGHQPVARMGSEAIYEEDLIPLIGGQLMQLKNQEYELKLGALTNLVSQRLLEGEAKRAGLSVEAFLEQTVDRNLPAWNAAELEGYYLAQKDRIKKPLAEVRPQLEQTFIQAKRQQARQDYIDRLREKANAAILLSPPRIEVSADPSRLRGSPEAAVTIVEFADFQCPYCQSVQPILKEVLSKYKGKVRIGFRDFPLRQIHPQAQQAAEAARCAGDQGKFWEYHDLLYANQTRLDPLSLEEYARTAGLDREPFAACLASGKFKVLIESDLQAGAASGVSGTPAFYINGVLLSGSQPASAFESIIESELADASSKGLAN